jgi:hypothetical protein
MEVFMKLIDKSSINHSVKGNWHSFQIGPISEGFLKIFIAGELTCLQGDRRMLLRINGLARPYLGFAVMRGNAEIGEWESGGFYLGRNGWSSDASFSAEITIGRVGTSQKWTAFGESAFAMGNGNFLGYHFRGVHSNADSVKSLDVGFTGGTFVGLQRIYQL